MVDSLTKKIKQAGSPMLAAYYHSLKFHWPEIPEPEFSVEEHPDRPSSYKLSWPSAPGAYSTTLSLHECGMMLSVGSNESRANSTWAGKTIAFPNFDDTISALKAKFAGETLVGECVAVLEV